MEAVPRTPEEFFAGHPLGMAAFERVCGLVGEVGSFEVRVSKSQVALRRGRGFAYLWLPGRYLTNPEAEVVLTIALDRRVESPRFKEVAHPTPTIWMHHLEVRDPEDLDDQVRRWVTEAVERAAGRPPPGESPSEPAARTPRVAKVGGSRRKDIPMGAEDKASNSVKDTKGKVKEKTGKLTDNERLENEGRGDQVEASAKERVEHLKDAAGNVKDAFKKQ